MTPVDLILWRSMVTAAQRRAVHRPPVGWQRGIGRLLRSVVRTVMMLPWARWTVSRRGAGIADEDVH
jgi:hypothetical protein